MSLSRRLIVLIAMLILARDDPIGAAAGHVGFNGPISSYAVEEPPFGPRGDCGGKTFFLYPVFKKLQIAPGERRAAFTGVEEVRSVVVLVSDSPFRFEMHGETYEPSVAEAPLPSAGYVLLEWSSPTSLTAANEMEADSRLPVPTRGFPIEDERKARKATARPLGSAQCRIVQEAGFLEELVEETVFGSTVSVEPHTELVIISAPSTSRALDRRPTTVWVSLFAAWRYGAEK